MENKIFMEIMNKKQRKMEYIIKNGVDKCYRKLRKEIVRDSEKFKKLSIDYDSNIDIDIDKLYIYQMCKKVYHFLDNSFNKPEPFDFIYVFTNLCTSEIFVSKAVGLITGNKTNKLIYWTRILINDLIEIKYINLYLYE